MEGCHVRDDDLEWPIHSFPCTEYEVGEPVTDLPRLAMHLVLRLGPDAKESEDLVGEIL